MFEKISLNMGIKLEISYPPETKTYPESLNQQINENFYNEKLDILLNLGIRSARIYSESTSQIFQSIEK